jgi:hypothetical protein
MAIQDEIRKSHLGLKKLVAALELPSLSTQPERLASELQALRQALEQDFRKENLWFQSVLVEAFELEDEVAEARDSELDIRDLLREISESKNPEKPLQELLEAVRTHIEDLELLHLPKLEKAIRQHRQRTRAA